MRVNNSVFRRYCATAAVVLLATQGDCQGPGTPALVISRLRKLSLPRWDPLSCLEEEEQHRTWWMLLTTWQAEHSGEAVCSIRCRYQFVYATPRERSWITVFSGLDSFSGGLVSIFESMLWNCLWRRSRLFHKVAEMSLPNYLPRLHHRFL